MLGNSWSIIGVGERDFYIAGGVNETCWVLGNSWSTIGVGEHDFCKKEVLGASWSTINVGEYDFYIAGEVNERCWVIVGELLVWVTMNLTLLMS